jgi:hypothetical protein
MDMMMMMMMMMMINFREMEKKFLGKALLLCIKL